MQIGQPTVTIIFLSSGRPEPGIEREMEARGVRMLWASCIKAAAGLLESRVEGTIVITELALADGNWMDLVERIGSLGRPIPIILLASAGTAELWWDALDCGVEEILVHPLSASQLCGVLRSRFLLPK
jgi:DNA-binding NtrC family response regulator